jgi:hypothetical protein
MPDSDEEYTPPGDATIPEQIDGGAAASISTSYTLESNSGQQRSSGSSFSLEDSPSSAKITVSTAVSIQPLQIHPIPEIDEVILFNSVSRETTRRNYNISSTNCFGTLSRTPRTPNPQPRSPNPPTTTLSSSSIS